MSRARLSGPAEARVIALAEECATAITDRFEASKSARGLLALVQEFDGDVHEIRVEVRGATAKGRRWGAGGWIAIPEIGIAPPEVEPDKPKRKRRKPKRRPAA